MRPIPGSTRPARPARAGRVGRRPADSRRRAGQHERETWPISSGWPRDPAHRRVLEGTAAALFVQQRRSRGTPFSEFEGMLGDGRGRARAGTAITDPATASAPASSRPTSPARSSSSASTCSSSEPVDEKDELDEDPTERGSRLHDILENFETLLKQVEGGPDLEWIAAVQVEQVRGRASWRSASELDQGLWEIERERLIRTIGQYVAAAQGLRARRRRPRSRPISLEFAFGETGAEYPMLELGHGERTRPAPRAGSIASTWPRRPRDSRFRVIDYKSGSVPSSTDVKQGEMLQLPLYAMAVERLLFQDGGDGTSSTWATGA